MKIIVLLFFYGSPLFTFSQTDSIKGNLKSVREQLVFLDSNIQNRKLFSTESEYGHYGFSSREFTINRFNNWWYNTYWTHYVNYKRLYNENNKVAEEIWFYKNGDTVTSFQFSYDTSNNITEEKEISEGAIKRITNTRYYNNEKPAASAALDLLYSGRFRYTYFTYNEKLALLKENWYDEEGYIGGAEYIYDTNGRKIKRFSKSAYVTEKINESQSSTGRRDTAIKKLVEQYAYDEYGNISAIQHYLEKGNNSYLSSVTNFYYDKKNRKISEYYNDKSNYNVHYQYFDDDLLKSIEYISTPDTALHLTFTTNRKLEYFYNKNKNVEKLIYRDDIKTWVIRFEYKFDSHNNWIEQTKIVDDKPLYVRKRDIAYWE